MGKKVAASIFDHFKVITDPRIDRNKLHNLTEIIVISILNSIGMVISTRTVDSKTTIERLL